ncbi:MAG: helix-turn-helix domain-containing protein [Defluviitaleaceae bacterium]|nr:helix-turn-helix domain-containing protein [Defluviitaleaceae bacterium]
MNIGGVGEFLKTSRKALKLTQGDVADNLGISAQAVSKWERGENMPDVAFLPDLSRILQVSVDQILNAGQIGNKDEDEIDFSNLVDAGLFNKVLTEIDKLQNMGDLQISLDFFVYLNNTQKAELIKKMLMIDDYGITLDEILPYASTTHKTDILRHILHRRDYNLLESIITHLSNELKTQTLQKLLQEGRYDIIEDIMPAFNRKHRDAIAEHFVNCKDPDELEIMENFIPFFDKNQIKRLFEEEVK